MDTLLKSVVKYSSIGLILFRVRCDFDGRITDFSYLITSPAAAQVSGSEEEPTNQTLLALPPTTGRDAFYARLLTVFETGIPQYYQHHCQGDGAGVWIDVTLIPVEDGVLGSFQNVTALMRQNLELELARKAAEEAHWVAEQALQVRDVFLANVSHEIRTPLNAMLGFSELLAEELTDPHQRAYAITVTDAGHTLLKLINNVLDLTKLDANQLEVESQPTSLTEVTASVANLLAARARQKDLHFVYTVAPDLPLVVLSDALRLTQILTNLGENAVKFTQEGQLELAVAVAERNDDGVLVTFRVSDTGIGIPAHRLPLVFDRYQQLSAEITRRYGGTGLGLSIVQSLVQRMGGSIEVSSEMGQGTTFLVQIPFVLPDLTIPTPVATAPPARTETLRPDRPITVLLVEDNLYNQRLVESLLQRTITLTKAGNGLEALAILRRQTVDVVLMDLQMPLMDGYTTTHHIRQTLGLAVPIIALTANAFPNERENCLRHGMTDYLTKPFTRQELTSMIAQHSQSQPEHSSSVGTRATVKQLDDAVLDDLYDTAWELLESQHELFEAEWPRQCQLLSESLTNRQMDLFKQYAHKFCSTLHALGMIHAAKSLKQLSLDYESSTPAGRGQQLGQFIDDVEEAIVELKHYIGQVKLLVG